MKYSDIPAKVPVPFANSGSKNTIPTPSQIGITAGAASLTDGFPPLTFTPVAAGGVPPSGKDFNGILYRLSENIRWSNAGSFYNFDSTFASSIGGYPKGAIVLRSDGAGFWQSTVDDNTTDPESTSASGWVPIIRVPTVSTGTATAYSVADNVGAYTTGAIYTFVAHTANTGSATIDFGAGAVSIVTPAGNTPSANEITANTTVQLRYNGTNFVLQNSYVDSSTFAALHGNSSNVFNVANATTNSEAVNLGQLPFTQFFESAQLSLTSEVILSAAHPFGVKPKMMWAVLICVTAELGYAVGDEVSFQYFDNSGNPSSSGPAPISADTSNLYMPTGDPSPNISPLVVQKVSGTTTADWSTITRANWNVILRAAV